MNKSLQPTAFSLYDQIENVNTLLKTPEYSVEMDEVNNNKPNNEGQSFNCSLCNTILKHKRHLKRHMLLHSAKDQIKCTVLGCSKIFQENYQVKQHIASVLEGKTVQCPICSKHLKRKTSLSLHMRAHANDFKYQCQICEGVSFQAGISVSR